MTAKTGKRLNHLGKSIVAAAQEKEKSKDELLSEIAFIDGALNAAIDAFVIFDLKGRPLKWNRVVAEMTGYSDRELGSLNVMDVVAKERRGDVARTLKKTLKDGRATIEVEVVSKNGDHIPLEVTGALLKDNKDRPIGLCAIGRDVTERKKAEKELVESELKFRTLFESASDAIFIHDLEGHFIEVNEVAVKRLGYSREELLTMTPVDIDTPEFAELIPSRMKLLEETGAAVFETAQIARGGKIIQLEVNCRVIEYQGQKCVLTIARDITDRKKAEEELRENESKYRFMAENLNDVAWTVDLNMNTTYASPSIEKVLRSEEHTSELQSHGT
jgi:PAS domain S-box-containing protein